MTSLAPLASLLQRHHALAFHHDSALNARLLAVQQWQKQRMCHTHQGLFARYPDMARYFLNRLYGGQDFGVLAAQIERVIAKAQRVEKLLPENTIRTGILGIELSVMAIELDEAVARWWLEHRPDEAQPTGALMQQAYRALGQDRLRHQQMDMLDQLASRLDQFVRSFMVQSVFKMVKGPMHKHGMGDLHDFVGEGFAAMKPLKSARDFIGVFTAAERALIDRVHSGHPDPFAPH